MALVLVQSPESQVASFRKTLEKFVADKTEETMCRMGAIMAAGILDAGGRNLTMGCRSPSGYLRRASVVGLALFTQYWYWYPLSYFLSLSFQPAALIGLNENLDLPKFDIRCASKKSLFAYPNPLTEEVSERSGKKIPTAVLSTTGRAKKKKEQDKKSKEAGSSSAPMDVDSKPTSPKAVTRKTVEPDTHTIENPARVIPQQEPFIEFPEGSRWVPVKSEARSGILILKDKKPSEPFDCVGDGAIPKKKEESKEPAVDADRMDIDTPVVPQAFEYIPDDD